MNLWVKSVRQLAVLAVASFFFSCEDEASLIGFPDQKPKFNVSYVDIPLTSSVILIDSFITDQKPFLNKYPNVGGTSFGSSVYASNYTVLAGEYNDPALGNTRAEAFLQMTPTAIARLDATSVYDSATIEVRFSYYSFGVSTDQQATFKIHEITGSALDGDLNSHYYSSTPPREINPTPLGEIKISVKYADLVKQNGLAEGAQDTLQGKTRLDDEFGKRLFDLAYNYTDSVFAKTEKFVQEIKGISIQPTQSNGIFGIYSFSQLTRIHVHYHYLKSGTVTNAVKSFTFSGSNLDKLYDPNYTSIIVNRGGSELAGAVPYQSFQTSSGTRVVQSGAPVTTKLDLSNFYAFADTVENVVINTAELVITNVESTPGLPTISSLVMKPMKGDLFTNHALDADSLSMIRYVRAGALIPDLKHYYLRKEDPNSTLNAAVLSYNSDKKQYSAFMTFFVQTLFENKNLSESDRIFSLGLQAGTPSPFTTLNRALFNAGNVKLRIFYTKPNQVEP
jgi:hypothetical protein